MATNKEPNKADKKSAKERKRDVINVEVPEDLREDLADMKEDTGVTYSHILRKALREAVEEWKRSREPRSEQKQMAMA